MIQTLTVPCAGRNPSAGPDGPPRNSVTAIADIVIRFMNSARKKMREADAGVLGVEATDELLLGLDEVERRVVGLGDRRDQEDHERDDRGAQYQSVTNECQLVQRLGVGDAAGQSVPDAEQDADDRRGRTRPRTRCSWADARTEPSSGYFEPLDQPASITP